MFGTSKRVVNSDDILFYCEDISAQTLEEKFVLALFATKASCDLTEDRIGGRIQSFEDVKCEVERPGDGRAFKVFDKKSEFVKHKLTVGDEGADVYYLVEDTSHYGIYKFRFTEESQEDWVLAVVVKGYFPVIHELLRIYLQASKACASAEDDYNSKLLRNERVFVIRAGERFEEFDNFRGISIVTQLSFRDCSRESFVSRSEEGWKMVGHRGIELVPMFQGVYEYQWEPYGGEYSQTNRKFYVGY